MTAHVIDNLDQHRFELPIKDSEIAVAYYRTVGDRVSLPHTEVPRRFSGQVLARGWRGASLTSSARAAAHAPGRERVAEAN
jgi:predicted GNAT family acetyltransferase